MKFKDVELLPGVVIDAADPKMLGRIKVTVPGVFDASVMNKEGLPWVYPITMTGYQGFSKLQEGSKVWVFRIIDGYREFWYMPMFEMNADTRQIISAYEEPDVLISRSAGANSVYIYYTDKEGIMLKLGENSFVNLKASGEIIAKSTEGQVSIRDGKVYVGDSNAEEPAILGNQLETLLINLSSNLTDFSNKAMGDEHTLPLSEPLAKAANDIMSDLKQIKCTHTIVS